MQVSQIVVVIPKIKDEKREKYCPLLLASVENETFPNRITVNNEKLNSLLRGTL